MKRLLLGICFLFIATTNTEATVKISGTIKNPQSRMVSFSIIEQWYKVPRLINVPLNDKNEFVLIYEAEKPVRISFTHAEASDNQMWYEASKFYEWVFEPKDEIKLSFDTKDFWKTIRIKGKNSAKFDYYLRDFLESDLIEKWRDKVEANSKLTVNQQYKFIEEVRAKKIAVLKAFTPKLSTFFYEFQKNEIDLMINSTKLAVLDQINSDSLTNQYKKDKGLVAFLSTFHAPQLSENTSLEYLNFINNFTEKSFVAKHGKQSNLMFNQYRTILLGKELIELSDIKNLFYLSKDPDNKLFFLEYAKDLNKAYPSSQYSHIIESILEEAKN